jgi:hypothetical protein
MALALGGDVDPVGGVMRVLSVPRLERACGLALRLFASAVTMAWTPIGDPGNPADTE